MRPLSLLGNDLGFHFTNLGLEGFAAPLPEAISLPPPPRRTVAVKKPTAKNAKYIRAAGCEMALGKIGGSANETELRLFKPIRTNNARTASTNIVLTNSFIKAAGP